MRRERVLRSDARRDASSRLRGNDGGGRDFRVGGKDGMGLGYLEGRRCFSAAILALQSAGRLESPCAFQ